MKLLTALVVLISSSVYAQLRCADKLLPAGRPSASHQLTQQEWLPTQAGPLTVSESAKAISALVFSKLLCRVGEIEIERNISCLPIDETRPELVTCSAYSSLGHFILTTDYSQNVNITFHKTPRTPVP